MLEMERRARTPPKPDSSNKEQGDVRLFFKMIEIEDARLFLIIRGCLKTICKLITQEACIGGLQIHGEKRGRSNLRERERKARTTLLMAIPEDHLAKFHKITDAKQLWEAIKSRFGGNDEARDNGRRPAKYDKHKAIVTIDGEGVDWTGHAEDNTENYALMAFNSSNLGSDTESKTSESDVETSNYASCESNSSVETFESVPKPDANKPKAVSEPKVWSDAPIIEEYELESDDEHVTIPLKEQENPSFAFVNTVKHVKTPRQTFKEQNTYSQNPKPNKRDWKDLMSKKLGLGYGFTKKACFVCGSFSHLIRDCDFHEKRMAKQVELNKQKGKSTGPRENRPVWNNVQRLNHQNKFVLTAILTKTGRFPINAARQNFSSQTTSTSTVRKVNTDEIRPKHNVYKSHSPIKRLFNRITAPKDNFSYHKVNTARDKTDDPQKALKNKRIIDSGCSRHMTGNKAYLVDYQDYNGGPVTFGELQHFNLFSVSQMCDKKNKVLFTNTECLVLSPDFKLPNENQVLLRVLRQNNMYSLNLENIVLAGGLACLIAKATVDESNK
nr:ribonuclease H-like domain-containing protein [Tanacetum cinerariifolium]GEW27828.1 ribonuclease H-like domain-containing protein [Tanacetum cinerariifolium]